MTVDVHTVVRRRIRVEGVVQGVGFRPFVYTVAVELGLTGQVGNDTDGVFIDAQGPARAVDALVTAIRTRSPALAVVERISSADAPVHDADAFVIVASRANAGVQTLVAPDAATCDDCLRELFDANDRRYRYAFLNCTNCGPRFTIVRGVPYDRQRTTMSSFPMCGECAREYADPRDRRYHAQPVCCPACGPTLTFTDKDGTQIDGDPITRAAEHLRAGAVLAIKGLGGYHLAAVAASEPAVTTLRSRKHREDKPFAVMAADMRAAASLAHISDDEAALLGSAARPVVLLDRQDDARVAAAVAPGNRRIGVLLPYTPMHHLLLHELGEAIVLTSGNQSDEPIAYLDQDARERLARIADAFLVHDRPIHIRTDDSVTQVAAGRELPVRRSRGYAPRPLTMRRAAPRPVLGCGAELKTTFCLLKGRHAFVSHHIGDLENYETLRSYVEGIDHFQRLFDVRPHVVAHDLHPEYLSTKHALALDDVEHVGVQHHHAHIASCLADNDEEGPVIGVAFDGLGYGDDGTLWGGELLVADLCDYERKGHLAPVPLPGGAAAIRAPWRMAASYLTTMYDGEVSDLGVVLRHAAQWPSVAALTRSGIAAPVTTSAGRLFDAVAAIAGVRDTVNYEGQAAVELEQRADLTHADRYPLPIDDAHGGLVLDTTRLVHAVVDDVRSDVPIASIAARFHNGLSHAVVCAVERIHEQSGLAVAALSGGVFQNRLLLGRVVDGLNRIGMRTLVHHRVPPNDGGVSLGQAAVAAARDRRASTDPG